MCLGRGTCVLVWLVTAAHCCSPQVAQRKPFLLITHLPRCRHSQSALSECSARFDWWGEMSGCARLNSFSAPLIVDFFKGQGGAFSLVKDGFWKTYGTAFCFVTAVVNSHLCCSLGCQDWAGGRGWAGPLMPPFSGWNLRLITHTRRGAR